MGAYKNKLIVDKEAEDCEYDGYAPELLESIRLQRQLDKTFFDRKIDGIIEILRRFVCK